MARMPCPQPTQRDGAQGHLSGAALLRSYEAWIRTQLQPGCLLVENPTLCKYMCDLTSTKNSIETAWRKFTSDHVFSLWTHDDYHHVLIYIGNHDVVHTRWGKVRIDSLDRFAAGFLCSCVVLFPAVDAIEAALRHAFGDPTQPTSSVSGAVRPPSWEDVWRDAMLPALLCAATQYRARCSYLAIMKVPHRRTAYSGACRAQHPMLARAKGALLPPSTRPPRGAHSADGPQQIDGAALWRVACARGFSCTEFVATVWLLCGVDLFECAGLPLDGLYPSDFIAHCPFFTRWQPVSALSLTHGVVGCVPSAPIPSPTAPRYFAFPPPRA